jgi:DNA-binding transcriptional regulator YiaG
MDMDNFDIDPDMVKSIREKFGISKDTFRQRADFMIKSKKNKEDVEKLLQLIKQLRDEESSC